jgi:hypothetical protein
MMIGFAVLILIVIGGLLAFKNYTPPVSSTPVSNADDMAIRTMVIEFGTKFKNVSLLAPDVSQTITTEYGQYVSADLLAQWVANPAGAPGRQTSSPWPESVDVVEVAPQGNGAYKVEANVIEVTNSNPKEVAATYPITMTVEKENDRFVVATFEKGAYSELPKRQTIVGYWECLPHKDTTGPQTDECAFGIAAEASDGHYAIDTRLMATYPVDFPTGTKVRVTGVVTPVEQLNSIQKYDIDGIISATSIEKI